MRTFASILFLHCLLFAHIVKGYFIDDSCNANQRRFVGTVIANAFAMGDRASAAFDNPSAQVQDLITWIFGTDPGTRQRLGPILRGIGTANTVHLSPDGLTHADFIVYCNDNRLQSRVGWVFDPDMGTSWKPLQQYSCGIATAYVVVPKLTSGKPSALQLCPWFLNYVMSQEQEYAAIIQLDNMQKLSIALKHEYYKKKFLPIDFLTLIDKVLLHEITHTSAGSKAIDVDGRKGYGWKNIRALSTAVTNRDRKIDGPERNSDSLAMFGSAVRIIEAGGWVNEDGTFNEPPAQRIERAVATMRARLLSPW